MTLSRLKRKLSKKESEQEKRYFAMFNPNPFEKGLSTVLIKPLIYDVSDRRQMQKTRT